MTSVRESLNEVGQSVSIRELAQQRNKSFPLSLRQFVGALPPGSILRKVVPLELLQRKFDDFFNNRSRPLFKIRLHNLGSGDHRHSTLDVFFDDPVEGYASMLTDRQPKDLGQLEVSLPFPFPDPDFYFADLDSNGLTLNVIPEQPVGIEAVLHFEPQGEEMKVNNFPNIDFDAFKIKIRFNLEFDSDNRLVDFRSEEKLIQTDASVDIAGLPDGLFASGIEDKMNTKIADALQEKEAHDKLNRLLTRWLVGGDFVVVAVEGNDQALLIDYLLPLGQLEPFPENPQPPLDPGLLANIDHIVVLMMENRSFDHMLGYLSKEGGRADVEGLRGVEKNSDQEGLAHSSFPLSGTRFGESPCHGHDCVTTQVNGGKLDGFVRNFADHLAKIAAKRPVTEGVVAEQVMGYYDAAKVPVYDALAREFLICQRWFAAHPGPTFPNRFYTLTGRLNRNPQGGWEFDNPHGGDFTPVFTRTIFDHLSDHVIPWHYYEQGYCFLRMFERYTLDNK